MQHGPRSNNGSSPEYPLGSMVSHQAQKLSGSKASLQEAGNRQSHARSQSVQPAKGSVNKEFAMRSMPEPGSASNSQGSSAASSQTWKHDTSQVRPAALQSSEFLIYPFKYRTTKELWNLQSFSALHSETCLCLLQGHLLLMHLHFILIPAFEVFIASDCQKAWGQHV